MRDLSALWRFLFFVVVDRNRIQVLRFENLVTIHAPDVIYAIPAIEELGSLVLTTLHSEITPILDCAELLSSLHQYPPS